MTSSTSIFWGPNYLFEEYNYPSEIESICTLDPIELNEISQKFNFDRLNSEEKETIQQLLSKFKDLFFKVQHEITTTVDKPLYSKIYRYPQVHETEINRQIQEMLKQNIIKKATLLIIAHCG